jgi:acetolactate synthase-1/2/3 large subunit
MRRLKLSGEEAVAQAIRECGINYFFYVEGAMAKLFPTIESQGVNTILCRNEKAACSMADGYSRVTNRPSMCFAQHGAAAAILASLLYEPMYSHSPVIALTGSIPTLEKDQWRFQECYEMPFFEPTCKFSADVTDVSRLPEYIRTATQIAVSGCPGPTHVNMHNDMATMIAEVPEVWADKIFHVAPPFRPRAERDKVEQAARLLAGADRAVMICGSGIHLSGAYDEVRELAELLALPVATNYAGKGCFPEDHPLSIGVMGSYGREVTNQIVRGADVVFFVGTRAGRHMTEEITAPEPSESRIIHLDIDPTSIGRVYRCDVALVGDAKVTLRDLLDALKTIVARAIPGQPRLQTINIAIGEYERTIRTMMESDAVPIKPQRMLREISKILGPRDIVVSDTGQTICWTTRFLKIRDAGRTYIPCGGTLGSSFPLAVGASFAAKKDQRVLNIIGDGGFAYNISELETARRYNDKHVPLVVLVNNNSSLAQARPKLEDWKNEKAPWINCTDLNDVNYAKIAEGFGCHGVRVERPSELGEAIREAFDCGEPAVVDVITDKREYAPIGLDRIGKKEVFPSAPAY